MPWTLGVLRRFLLSRAGAVALLAIALVTALAIWQGAGGTNLIPSAVDPMAAADRIAAYAAARGGRIAARTDQNGTPFPQPLPYPVVGAPASGGAAQFAQPLPPIARPVPAPYGRQSTLTLRVPEASLDDLVQRIRDDAALALARFQLSSNDVTSQLVDLDARLSAKRLEEARYQALLAKADKMADIVQLSQILGSVQTDLERLTAQRAQLANQVAYSTLVVIITAPPTTTVEPAPVGFDPLGIVRDTLVGMGAAAEVALALLIRIAVVASPLLLFVLLLQGALALRRRSTR